MAELVTECGELGGGSTFRKRTGERYHFSFCRILRRFSLGTLVVQLRPSASSGKISALFRMYRLGRLQGSVGHAVRAAGCDDNALVVGLFLNVM